MKLIEGDSVSAMEVGHALNVFVESLESRKKNNFLSTAVQKEIERTAIDDETVTKERVLITARPFYGSYYHFSYVECTLFLTFFSIYLLAECVSYIQMWIAQFDHVMIFVWSALDQPPEWEYVEASAKLIASKNRFDIESCDTELFDQFTHLNKYVTAEKIQSWEENSIATDQRWVECFKHFAKKNIPYNHLLKIVSYILCLPGTSATVERLFSLINDIWSIDKARLSIGTLRDLLYVRYNIKMSCLEFFEFLKGQPKMLEDIGSDGKYAFKNRDK